MSGNGKVQPGEDQKATAWPGEASYAMAIEKLGIRGGD